MVSALIPEASHIRATSTILMLAASHPRRVFSVTGLRTALTTAEASFSIFERSRRSPAPAPRMATSRTQQPQLISMMSGSISSTIRAAPSIAPTSPPYTWIPIGRSSARKDILFRVFIEPRTSPSELTNSVNTMSAPRRLQRSRNGRSVTSSMGARRMGRSMSMGPIFMEERYRHWPAEATSGHQPSQRRHRATIASQSCSYWASR